MVQKRSDCHEKLSHFFYQDTWALCPKFMINNRPTVYDSRKYSLIVIIVLSFKFTKIQIRNFLVQFDISRLLRYFMYENFESNDVE